MENAKKVGPHNAKFAEVVALFVKSPRTAHDIMSAIDCPRHDQVLGYIDALRWEGLIAMTGHRGREPVYKWGLHHVDAPTKKLMRQPGARLARFSEAVRRLAEERHSVPDLMKALETSCHEQVSSYITALKEEGLLYIREWRGKSPVYQWQTEVCGEEDAPKSWNIGRPIPEKFQNMGLTHSEESQA